MNSSRDNVSPINQLEQDHSATLAKLEPSIKAAIDFAEQWDEHYRPHIFEVAMAHLTKSITSALTSELGTPSGSTSGSASDVLEAQYRGDSVTPLSRLAQAVNVDLDHLQRVVQINEDETIEIYGRIGEDFDSIRDKQNKHSVVYAFIKEKALGKQTIEIEELRDLCKKHGCYNPPNFTLYFRNDQRLLERKGEGRAKQYVATRKGLEEAADLIRQMVEN